MVLKIVYKICYGIDVYKTFVGTCIAHTNAKNVTTYESHRFLTHTNGLKNLLQWLLARNYNNSCMESTGKCWINFWEIPQLLLLTLNLPTTKLWKETF